MVADTFNSLRDAEFIMIDEGYYLSDPLERDIPELVKYLNDDVMYENTLKIPKPYTTTDGLWYINFCMERKKLFGRTMEWCIRNEKNELIGGIGLQGNVSESTHREIIGYWLGRPYWNKKIMSRTMNAFCNYVLLRDHLVRLEAHVYVHNTASCRILEKAGFVQEALMKKFILKDGQFIDTYLYALVK